jgi:hypothetical protein
MKQTRPPSPNGKCIVRGKYGKKYNATDVLTEDE